MIFDPPVDAGADQVTATIPVALSAVAAVIVGAPAGATKVIVIAALAVPVSTAFPATTVTEYVAPAVRPEMLQVVLVVVHVEALPPPLGVTDAVYPVIAEPPLFEGGVQLIAAVDEPDT